ncbi:uncharacterized protein LACBIDRAFT_332714 [Laccaria bicolor S238N-H82]|uniref:Predicted protein n=1 Tax=Laccaria bicolor (strain S238N-H82 / ATCC MYA-4686) TaxID=486041 RepID=B0DTN5_LACBS|nr:uncharacterized protein LACBIDRAFT_332714 [Laccaria bicolor S238N-H82]EDR02147.1 predicted protein [Laccaria bicolor S238N-H82]|eukprot:XP_001887304.1 predicted protein [Laccaria bicolor S238N-H82]
MTSIDFYDSRYDLQSISVNTTDFVVSRLSFSNASVFDAYAELANVAILSLAWSRVFLSMARFTDASVFDAYAGTAVHVFLNGLMQFFSLCWVFTLEPLRALFHVNCAGVFIRDDLYR